MDILEATANSWDDGGAGGQEVAESSTPGQAGHGRPGRMGQRRGPAGWVKERPGDAKNVFGIVSIFVRSTKFNSGYYEYLLKIY